MELVEKGGVRSFSLWTGSTDHEHRNFIATQPCDKQLALNRKLEAVFYHLKPSTYTVAQILSFFFPK